MFRKASLQNPVSVQPGRLYHSPFNAGNSSAIKPIDDSRASTLCRGNNRDELQGICIFRLRRAPDIPQPACNITLTQLQHSLFILLLPATH
jgi:hypothetical protein